MSKPSARDHARQSALYNYEALMRCCLSIIAALEPFQDVLVQGVTAGKNVVSAEVFLQQFAKEILVQTRNGLGANGFLATPKQPESPPADAPLPPPKLVTDEESS